MANEPQTLAQLVRAKFPGAYDDIDDVTLEQRVLQKYPAYKDLPLTADPKSGRGMEQLAGQKEQQRIASQVKPSLATEVLTGDKQLLSMQPGLPSAASVDENAKRMSQGAMIGAPVGGLIAGGTAALPAIGRGLVGAWAGSKAGGWAGKEAGSLVNAPDTGEKIGSVVGGIAGGAGLTPQALRATLFGASESAAPEFMKISEGPNAAEYAAVRAAQRAALTRNTRSFVPLSESPNAGTPPPSVGSAQQEAGWQPQVTKVPIRPEPSYKLTPESVPGPDTSGKGNLLTPLARKGDARAATELLRRGRQVLFTPDADAASYVDAQKFADLLKSLE